MAAQESGNGAKIAADGEFTLRVGDWQTLGGPASAVRLAVFVQEQRIPAEMELDARDAGCTHVVAFDRTGQPVGTGRLLPDAHIGRMAVMPALRGRGVGAAMLHALMNVAARQGMREVRLHAQASAVGFYARAGYAPEGSAYEEAGIPHQTMVRKLADA